MKRFIIYISLTIVLVQFSCTGFIKIDPPQTQLVTADVFSSDATATSAVLGIYSEMMNTSDFASGGVASVEFLTSLSSDELLNFSTDPDLNNFNINSLTAINVTVRDPLWVKAYKLIYYANSILEGLSTTTAVSKATSLQLQGEAKFIRAFCYFQLVNLYGDVPLVTVTDYLQNISLARSPAASVYDLIVQDLTDAASLLSPDYIDDQRIRPNNAAASALLSRVYLYTSQWAKAESVATTILNQASLYKLVSPDSVFLANSSEAIWQLLPVTGSLDTYEGSIYILQSAPAYASLRNEFLASFEPSDLRRTSWVDTITVDDQLYYFPFKYKIQYGPDQSEYEMVLRFAELYLIRAEARIQQNNISGAQDDLNIIRSRAGLPNTVASDKSAILLAIEQERKVELFTEWGHRWYDLKRTGRADAVLGPLKGSTWQSTDVLYPIPQTEIASDLHLTQNAGY